MFSTDSNVGDEKREALPEWVVLCLEYASCGHAALARMLKVISRSGEFELMNLKA